MKVTYDGRSQFLYVYTDNPVPVRHTKNVAPGVNIDLDAKGRVVGVEIWGGPLTMEVTP